MPRHGIELAFSESGSQRGRQNCCCGRCPGNRRYFWVYEHRGGDAWLSPHARPASVGYFDTMMDASLGDERFEELLVEPGTRLDGFKLSDIEENCGVYILAHRQSGGRILVRPDTGTEVRAGDPLVVHETTEQCDSPGG